MTGSHPRLQSATAEATFRKSHELQVQTGEVHRARRQNGPLGGRGRGPGLSQRWRWHDLTATEVWGEGKGRTVNDERGQVTGGTAAPGAQEGGPGKDAVRLQKGESR